MAPPIDRLIGLPHMRADVQWHRVEGLWFEVTFRPVTEHSTTSACYDVLLKRIVTPHQRALLWQRYGSATLHAHRKHQLDGKTLSRFSLVD